MTESPKRIWSKNTIIFQARLWSDKEPVAPRHDPDKYCAYVRADIADEMLHFIRQLFNGLETGMIKFETPADEAMALLLRKGRNAIAKAEAAKWYRFQNITQNKTIQIGGNVMTTPRAAQYYLGEHIQEWRGKRAAVFNPYRKPLEELPIIYGFNNGGSPGWWTAVLIAEDGTGLGSHICSAEAYMPHDLGVLDDSRPDRHMRFRKHYPGGYRMDFVKACDVLAHTELSVAHKKNQEKAAIAKAEANGEI